MSIRRMPSNVRRNYSTRTIHPPSVTFLAFAFSFLVLALVIVSYLRTCREMQMPAATYELPTYNVPKSIVSPAPIFPLPNINSSLPTYPQTQWLGVVIQPGETLASIFSQFNLSSDQLDTLLALPLAASSLQKLIPNHELQIQINNQGQVLQLVYPIAKNKTLLISSDNHQFTAQFSTAPLVPHLRHVYGVIENSLIDTLQASQIPEKVLNQMATLFSWKLDFANEIHEGDRFNLLYEDYTLDNKQVSSGDITAVEVISSTGEKQAVFRYADAHHQPAYYTANGMSLGQSFLKYPVQFTHVSSGFFPHGRYHPILHIFRPHMGVDLAAPIGTPIHTIGDGKIVYRNFHGGYGRVIIVDHGHGYTTLYAHLSRFAANEDLGSQVHAGEIIGYVGASGLATGPHLHYEFRINGIHYDPLHMELPQATTLTGKERTKFLALEQQMKKDLAEHASS